MNLIQKVTVRNPVALVLLISGSTGFLIGSLQHGTWQLAVESAQVLAGVVEYPKHNPFYMHHTKLWSLLHQICVPFLLIGVSERTLSFLFSGIMGMLSFQALSLTVWALCNDLLLSLASPFMIVFTHATKYCAIYPVVLMGTSNTHGMIGLALVLLIIAFIGSGKFKHSMFLLGLLPSVHLALGALSWAVIILCALLSGPPVREQLVAAKKYFFIGLSITVASLAVQFLWSYDQPYLSMKEGSRYIHIFVRNWDSHRIPIALSNPGLLLNFVTFGVTLIWIQKHPDQRGSARHFPLLALAVAAVLGGFFAFVSRIPPEKLPAFLIIMMPARILELNVLAISALLIGLSAQMKKSLLGAGLLAAVAAVGWILSGLPLHVLLAFAFGVCILPFVSFERTTRAATAIRTIALLILLIMTINLISKPDLFRQEPEEWNNFALVDDQVLMQASRGNDLLLTASDLHLIQLRTRRPVVLDGGQLDILPYTYESGPEMTRILKEVYGVSFSDPPPEAKRTARIRVNAHRTLWEKRDRKNWQQLAAKFGPTQVLTYPDWKLALPVVAQNHNFLLYQIPAP
ncbi:hypothetical protein L0222_10905 [bacterium]|nr:hypothetical protein [bacterium]MCI0604552.1 hypothetical protein [bacterium]